MFAVALALVAGACADDEKGAHRHRVRHVDVTTVGLWDDGPCDDVARPARSSGMQATFESPILTAEDQALALEASAVAFNARGRSERSLHRGGRPVTRRLIPTRR